MTRPHACIFDLDGTLVDSLRDIATALNSALDDLNLPRVDLRSVRDWVGDGLPALCRRAQPRADETTVKRLVECAARHYRNHCVDHTRPYPNILAMLKLLRSKGLPLAVISNKPHDLVELTLRGLGLIQYFEEVRGFVDEREKKPCPKHAIQVASNFECAPRLVCLIGDSPVDIRTARNAGMIAVAVAWGFRKIGELEAERPDFLVHSPDEIISLFD
ncbi:MAG: HAD-IA family hydrolase [Planctomycetota bacterium]|nr:HAD-IA family hydrolase [Planctomycetota bacterium]